MPLTLGAGTAIAAGVGALSSGANMVFRGNMNRKNRKFSVEQYERQREDELAFWRMNNEYNHPSAQMARLRESGLNPHLVYGKGSVVGNTSGAPNAPQQARWQGEPVQVDPSFATEGLNQYFNLTAKKAQTDNMRAQNTLLEQESMLKRLGILKKAFDLNIDYETRKQIIDKIVLGVGKLKAEKMFTEEKAIEQWYDSYVAQMKFSKDSWLKDIKNVELKNQLMSEHLRMRKQGIEPGDKAWMRGITAVLNAFGVSLDTIQKFFTK